MGSDSFMVVSLEFSVYRITSFANNYSFTFLFNLDSFHLFFFCPLIAMDRNSKAIMNKNCENEHPYLVSNLRRMLLDFHH